MALRRSDAVPQPMELTAMNSSVRSARLPMLQCAIYTRKSSEDGLEQEFNSLDAQREACEAYVRSQKHEGWVLLPTHYDDGGLSGGPMDRPVLQRLLADVKAGKVNVVVVYKIDRLTRSLTVFARVVETLDEHGASFVSVTQQFNTTTRMDNRVSRRLPGSRGRAEKQDRLSFEPVGCGSSVPYPTGSHCAQPQYLDRPKRAETPKRAALGFWLSCGPLVIGRFDWFSTVGG
jgi:predicted site-specific integrase-resolvase